MIYSGFSSKRGGQHIALYLYEKKKEKKSRSTAVLVLARSRLLYRSVPGSLLYLSQISNHLGNGGLEEVSYTIQLQTAGRPVRCVVLYCSFGLISIGGEGGPI